MTYIKLLKTRALAILLLFSLLLSGCFSNPLRTNESSVPQTEQTSENDNNGATEENAAKEQERFDTLMDELFRYQVASSQILLHFMLKNPETYGITECRQFYDDYTLATQLADMDENKELLNQLSSFDSRLLTNEQKRTYFIFQEYLKTELLSDGMELYLNPLSTTIGVQAQLPILLCEYTFYDEQDVEDYLLLLANLDSYYSQLIDFYRQKADAGLMPGDRTIDHIIESCESYLVVSDDNFMIETFNSRLETVPDLTQEAKAAYSERNTTLLAEHFAPAYQLLIDGLTKLKGTGGNDQGICYFPDGKRYYEYLVDSVTGTSYRSIDDLLDAMEGQLIADLTTISKIVTDYPDLLDEIETYAFRLTDPVEILEDLKVQIQKDFPDLPTCNYTIKSVPEALELTLSPAFYLTPPIDDAMNNSIYINRGSVSTEEGSSNLYTVLAHEGYPGHLYQSVFFYSTGAPEIRQILSFEGYSEGWATYVERYSYTLENGLDPKMGELIAANSYASLGLQAILDVYINYYGWDLNEVQDFLADFYNDPDMELVQSIFDAMVENPANYLSYYVGFLEIEAMRTEAEKSLKGDFDLTEFHSFILEMGPAPFSVIRNYFSSWMELQKK